MSDNNSEKDAKFTEEEEPEITEEGELADEEDEDGDDIIELIDDDDNIIKFKLHGVTEFKGCKYTVLLPAEPNEDIAEDEVVIMRLNEESETLEAIDDEQLLQDVFDYYVAEQADDETEN